MPHQQLFEPLKLGELTLKHRVVMAPLTRMRATVPGNTANGLNAEHYGQRASEGGLIIAEASQVMVGGSPSPTTPGIHDPEQVEGWKLVTEAVHAKGGHIFLQLWHSGRVSHSSLQPDGRAPRAPSAVPLEGKVGTAHGKPAPAETPRALETAEIPEIIAAYVQAARNAMEAGFDGVEIHAANGYLLEQFLQSRTNRRTDAYGGSIENRCRIVLDIVRGIVEAIGGERTGIRLSPYGVANGSGEDDPMPLYSYLVRELNALGLAYLHLIEPRASGAGQREVDHQGVPSAAKLFRPLWDAVLIAAGNFRGDTAEAMVAGGHADAIAFGRLFTSNPDLPRRLQLGTPLTPYDRSTFYTRGPEGYTDFPEMDVA
ncbi:MAG: alkene reductase [Ectothiorhodospiraceae bacterium]|nr:alkene reductase [Ectothiorhodospiraceae bacterium]